MPSLGADMEAGTLVEWLVKPGDRVKRGDIVAVVETQKGAIEIETYQAGAIEQILVDLHSKVPVGTPLARIRVEGEAKPAAPGAVPPPTALELPAAPAPPPVQVPAPRRPPSRRARRPIFGCHRLRAGLLKSATSIFQRSPAAVPQAQ